MREAILEHGGELADRRGRRHRRPQDRHASARSPSSMTSRRISAPPVTSKHGTFSVEALRQRAGAAPAVQALEEAHFALAEQQDAAGLQVFVEAGEGEAGLLDVGAGDPAVQAAAPASSSIDRPTDSGRASSSPRTVTAGSRSDRDSVPPRRDGRGKLEQDLSLVRRRNLQLFAVLRDRAPRQHQAFALQDVDDLRIAERLLRILALR